MTDLPVDLLDRPAPEGARWLALARLDALVLARKRLDDPGAGDALHDFRVALRRLRSVERAYRSVLRDSISRGDRRRLARMAEVAGASRDTEVRLDWLARRSGSIEAPDRPAFAWVENQLRRERRAGERKLRRELDREYEAVIGRLERRLMRFCIGLHPGEVRAIPTSREMVSGTLLALAGALAANLDAPRSVREVRTLHLARIAAKRLRYVLEPLANGGISRPRIARSAGVAVARLARLQDELGRINDAHLFRRWLRERSVEHPPGFPNLRARVAGVRRVLADEAAESFAAVRLAGNERRLQRTLRAVRDAAAAMARPNPVESPTAPGDGMRPA